MKGSEWLTLPPPHAEDWLRTRDRNSRAKISSHHREKTTLQKTMNVPDDLFYTESHEWVRMEGENARIGITDHAQAELTDVVYVELPKVGAQGGGERPDRGRGIGKGGERYLCAGGRHGGGSEQSAGRKSGVDQHRPIRGRMDLRPEDGFAGRRQATERRGCLSRRDRLALRFDPDLHGRGRTKHFFHTTGRGRPGARRPRGSCSR